MAQDPTRAPALTDPATQAVLSQHLGAPADRRIVLSTRNAHKVGELRAILAPVLDELGLELVGLDSPGLPEVPEVVEGEITFEGNALLKARAAARATGLPALADDSGLAVDVLGGAPGIFSARWAGRHGDDRANHELLLAQVADVPDAHRGAEFVCAAALALPDGTELTRRGECRGRLTREPRGAGGFGYDPVVEYSPADLTRRFAAAVDRGDLAGEEYGQPQTQARTGAELTAPEKNAISHRAAAFRALGADLKEHLS